MENLDEIDKLMNDINHPKAPAAPRSSHPNAPYNRVNHPSSRHLSNTLRADAQIPDSSELRALEQNYIQNGGNDPEFLEKVRDLNDFVSGVKPPSRAPMSRGID